MIRRAVLGYVVLTAAWLAAGIALSPGMAYGYTVARLSIWWGLLVMLMATAYYAIQEWPAAWVTGWLKRDLAINVLLFLVVAFTLLDGIQGSIVLGLRPSGAIVTPSSRAMRQSQINTSGCNSRAMRMASSAVPAASTQYPWYCR